MKQDYDIDNLEQLRQADTNLREAISRHQQQMPQLPDDFAQRLLRRRRTHQWRKLAAMFVGFLLLSGLTFAAIQVVVRHAQPTANEQTAEANSQLLTPNSSLHSPVRFDDVPLDSILSVVSVHYGKAVSFRNGEARALKFITTWHPDAPLTDFIERLNLFDGLRLSLQRDTIVVETTEGKEDAE